MKKSPKHNKPEITFQTTSRPDWWKATKAEDILPEPWDPTGDGARFCEMAGAFVLTQGEGAGQRFSERMLPWQKRYLTLLGGGIDPTTNRRILRSSFLLLGKGSGKSTLSCSILLSAVMLNHHRGVNRRTDAILMAADVRTAKLLADSLEAGISADPFLKKEFKFSAREASATHLPSGQVIRTLPVSINAAIGRRPSILLFDEVWASSTKNNFTRVHDQLKRGASNSIDPIVLYASTASIDEPVGVYAQLLDYGTRVQSGEIIDPTFLPALFRMPVAHYPPSVDMLGDSRFYIFGMPSALDEGGTQTLEELKNEVQEARMKGGHELTLLLSQRFNLDSAQRTTSETNSILREWDNIPDFDLPERFTGHLTIGVDVGGLNDPQAVTLCWHDPQVFPGYCFYTRQFISAEALAKQSPQSREMMRLAEEAGELFVLDTTAGVDESTVAFINSARELSWDTPWLGGDLYGRGGVATKLKVETTLEFRATPQNFKLRPAFIQLESLPEDGLVSLYKSPLLRWNFRNIRVDMASTGVVFTKADQGGGDHAKIDGVMSLLSALTLMNEKLSTEVQFDPRTAIY